MTRPSQLVQPSPKHGECKTTENVAWDADYKLLFIGGEEMTAVTSFPIPAAQPGQQVNISMELTAPTTPGTYFCDWRLVDAQGSQYGDIIYARILAESAPEPIGAVADGHFLADITIPDDTQLEPGQSFTKTWHVKNNGDRVWGNGFTLAFIGGTNMAAANSIPLPAATPGAEVEISIPMTAPTAPGVYFADWRLKDDTGAPFGDTVYLRIIVPSPAGTSLAKPMSQRDPLWNNTLLGHTGSPQNHRPMGLPDDLPGHDRQHFWQRHNPSPIQ